MDLILLLPHARTLVPELMKELAARGASHVVVVAGGIIPQQVGILGVETVESIVHFSCSCHCLCGRVARGRS